MKGKMKSKTKLVAGIMIAVLVAAIGITVTLVVTALLGKDQGRIVRNEGDLRAAVTEAGDETIVLAGDITVGGDLSMTVLRDLDLNGHTLTVTGAFGIASDAEGEMWFGHDGNGSSTGGTVAAGKLAVDAPNAHIEWNGDVKLASAGADAFTVRTSGSTFVMNGRILGAGGAVAAAPELTVKGGSLEIASTAENVTYKVTVDADGPRVRNAAPVTSSVVVNTARPVTVGGAVTVVASSENAVITAETSSSVTVQGTAGDVKATGASVVVDENAAVKKVEAADVVNKGTAEEVKATGRVENAENATAGKVEAADVVNKGTIADGVKATGKVENEGTVNGGIDAGAVENKENGKITGDVTAGDVVNDGEVEGKVDASGSVENNGKVDGDVSAGTGITGDGEVTGGQTVAEKTAVKAPAAPAVTDFVFNGAAQGIEVASDPLYTIDGALTATDAGEYTVTVALKDKENTVWTDGSSGDITFKFTIAKADNAWDAEYDTPDYTYGETPATADADAKFGDVVVKFYADADCTEEIAGMTGFTAATKAGTYYVKASVAATDNYAGLEEVYTVVIAKAEVDVPSAEVTSFVYDGDPHNITLPASDLYTLVSEAQTDVGEYTATVSLVDPDNYKWKGGDSADLTIKWTVSQEENVWRIEYDTPDFIYGKPSATTAAAAKFGDVVVKYYADADCTEEIAGMTGFTAATKAGTYYVKVSVEATKNYTGLSEVYAVVVAKVKVARPDTSEVKSFAYNGKEQTAFTAPADAEYTVSGNVQTQVGPYSVTFALPDGENYEWADGGIEDIVARWEIRRGTATVTTADELKAAFADAGYAAIKLGANINIDAVIRIDRDVTLDLGAFTLAVTKGADANAFGDKDYGGVALRVNKGGELTIKGADGAIDGRGADKVVPVAAMGGNVIIESGTIVVDTATESCVFARYGGKVTIRGGSFINECEGQYAYDKGVPLTLNVGNNTNGVDDEKGGTGSIEVLGGTFVGRSPEAGDDVLGGNFVAGGVKVAGNLTVNKYYVLAAGASVPEDLDYVCHYGDTVGGVAVAVSADVYTDKGFAHALSVTDNIKLMGDMSADAALLNAVTMADGALTIDLGGKALTLTTEDPKGSTVLVTDGCEFTVKNGTLNAYNAKSTTSCFSIESGSTMTLDHVKVDSTGSVLFPRGDAAAVNVIDSEITTTGVFGIGTNAGKDGNYGVIITVTRSTITAAPADGDGAAVLINVGGVLNISDSAINSTRQGVIVRAGEATLDNVDVSVDLKYAGGADRDINPADWEAGDEVAYGALVVGNNTAGTYRADARVKVNGGSLNATTALPALADHTNALYAVRLNSNEFTTNVALSGTKIAGQVVNYHGTATVTGLPEGTEVISALVGSEESLNAAVSAGGYVKLAGDIAVQKSVSISSKDKAVDMVLDLNGHTLSTDKAALLLLVRSAQLANGSIKAEAFAHPVALTVKNGTLIGDTAAAYYGIAIESLSENLTLTLENVASTAYYAGIYANGQGSGAKVTATGCSFKGTESVNGDSLGAYLPANNNYTFKNCSFTGYDGAYLKSGAYLFDGCSFISNGDTFKEEEYNGSGANPVGAGMTVDSSNGYSPLLKIEVVGGSFESQTGYAVVEYATGNVKEPYAEVTLSNTVALNGNKVLSKNGLVFAEASNKAEFDRFAAAGSGIRLVQNITADLTVAANSALVLDLNGCTLTGKIVNNGTLTIKDSSPNKAGAVVSTSDHAVYNNGTLTINGGTFDAQAHAKAALYNNSGAMVNIAGGTFVRSGEKGTPAGGNGNSWYVVYNRGTLNMTDGEIVGTSGFSSTFVNVGTKSAKATANIDGGYISGRRIAVKNDDFGVLNITDGRFEITADAAADGSGSEVLLNAATATVGGGTFVNNAPEGNKAMVIYNLGYAHDGLENEAVLTITDGTFTATAADARPVYQATSSGSAAKPHPEYVAKPVIDVKGGTFDCAISELDLKTYGTAYDKAELDRMLAVGIDVITLGADITTDGQIVVADNNVTLDLNGHRIATTHAFGIKVVSGSLTVSGTAAGSGVTAKSYALACLGGELTVDGGNYGASEYALIAGGDVTVNDGFFATTNESNGDASAALVQTDGSLTINDGVFTATGDNIAVRVGAGNTKGTLVIENGTFIGAEDGARGEGIATFNGSQVTINSGTFKFSRVISGNNGNAEMNITVNGGDFTATNDVLIYMPAQGTLKLLGGTFTGPTIIDARMGDITIGDGAKLHATGAHKLYNGDGSELSGQSAAEGSAIVLNAEYYAKGSGTNNDFALVIAPGASVTADNGPAVTVYYWGRNEQMTNFELGGATNATYGCYGGVIVPITLDESGAITYNVENGEQLAAVAGIENADIVLTDDITLFSDIVLASPLKIPANADITLDLNGKTITYTAAIGTRPVLISGKLTVRNGEDNSAAKGKGGITCTNAGTYGVFDCLDGSDTAIYGGYYLTNGADGGAVLKVRDNAAAVVHNGSFVCEGYDAAVMNEGDLTINDGYFYTDSSNKGNYNYCVKSNSDKMTINNATVVGVQGGIAIFGGAATINDCDVLVRDNVYEAGQDTIDRSYYALYVAGEAAEVTCTVNGGKFVANNLYALKVGNSNKGGDGGLMLNASIMINGGDFRGKQSAISVDAALGTAIIFGGTYNTDVSGYIGADMTCVKNSVTEKYEVIKLNYSIGTAAELRELSENGVLDRYPNVKFNIELTADIDLGNVPFESLAKNGFSGTFDGQGYTISNLVIDATTGEADAELAAIKSAGGSVSAFTGKHGNTGLIAKLTTPGTITGVTVHNASVDGYSSVGVIAGGAYTGAVDDCHVTGLINVEGYYMVGGIAGSGYASINDCSVIGDAGSYVKGTHYMDDLEGDNVGGIVGFTGEGNGTYNGLTAKIDVYGSRKVGGLIGYLHYGKNVENSAYDGTVHGNSPLDYRNGGADKNLFLGGIAGEYAGNATYGNALTNCTAKVTFVTDNDGVTNVTGGIVGGTRGSSALLTVTDCLVYNADGELVENITCAAGEMTYNISSAAMLSHIAELTNEGHGFAGETVLLTADIDLGGLEWTPIGNGNTPFAGTFDGGGHTVSNLKASANTTPGYEDRSIGLIGYASGSVVKNLKIANCEISGRYAVGAVVGEADGPMLFENIEVVSGTVVADRDSGSSVAQVAGGILGVGYGDNKEAGELVFKNCVNRANVTVNKWHAGGLWGSITFAGKADVTVENCHNYGAITSLSMSEGGYAGGFGGYFAAQSLAITDSANNGIVTADKYRGDLVGYSTLVGGSVNAEA